MRANDMTGDLSPHLTVETDSLTSVWLEQDRSKELKLPESHVQAAVTQSYALYYGAPKSHPAAFTPTQVALRPFHLHCYASLRARAMPPRCAMAQPMQAHRVRVRSGFTIIAIGCGIIAYLLVHESRAWRHLVWDVLHATGITDAQHKTLRDLVRPVFGILPHSAILHELRRRLVEGVLSLHVEAHTEPPFCLVGRDRHRYLLHLHASRVPVWF